jgi:single-stranded-DNA-specific exonuclease
MVERFGKPSVIITTVVTESGEREAKGSFRSPTGFNVADSLTYCKDLLVKFGGHAGAGGFSILEENIDLFSQKLQEFAQKSYDETGVLPAAEIVADILPHPQTLTVENIVKLELLQAFGEGNPQPVFCLKHCYIKHKRPLKEGKFTAFTVMCSGYEFKMLDFSRQYTDFWYKVGDFVDVMANIDVNEYNNVTSLSIKVINMRLSSPKGTQDKFFAAKDVYDKIKRGDEIDEKLLVRIIPSDDEFKAVYSLIKTAYSLGEVAERAMLRGLNYCKLRIITDIFVEMGIVEFDPVTEWLKLVPNVPKADLSKSEILTKLKGVGTL